MSPSVSEQAVREATGREWDYWFALLAEAEAATAEGTTAFGRPDSAADARPDELDHPALAAILESEHPELSGWWRQQIVVEYEREMGRRVVGQTADGGFQLGAQKTVTASPDRVWAALIDPAGLPAWLGDDVDLTLEEGATYGDPAAGRELSGEIRVLVPGRRVRLTWQPGPWPRPSTLQVRVDAKGNGKTRVRIHHEHLPDADAREHMRTRWQAALEELARTVEG